MNSSTSIKIRNLSKIYAVYDNPANRLKQTFYRGSKSFYKESTALLPIDLDINKGEILGIVGRNGSGKSTLLQLICGTVTPTSGEVEVDGRISALLELGSGFNPEFTGKDNVYLNASILGFSQDEIDKKYDSIIEFSGIKDHINRPVKTYSSGMYVRLAFSVAIATEPDILIVDEALAVGDEIFQRKCYSRINELKENGTTILFVSHSANKVIELCDRAILLDSGELLLDGKPKKVISYYHKLIFAPSNSIKDVKEEIKQEFQSEDNTSTEGKSNIDLSCNNKILNETSEVIYDIHMIPETTLVHEDKGVDIIDYNILTLNNEKINYLHMDKEYKIKFSAIFKEDKFKIRFNYRIHNEKGIVITGYNSHESDGDLEFISAGSKYEIEFNFKCLLTSGTYYITLGCSGHDDKGKEPIQRVHDAMMFKVIEGIEDFSAGSVRLNKNVKVKSI